jgi:hypothetical protein
VSQSTYADKDGKCYDKCIEQPVYEFWEETYPVYLGEYHDSLMFLEKMKIIIRPAVEIRVEDKFFGNCNPLGPNEHLRWNSEEIPAEFIEIVIVKDTNHIKNFICKKYEFKELISGGKSIRKEVLCQDQQSISLNRKIQFALKDLGYYNYPVENFINRYARRAIQQFQKDSGLAWGKLSIETLEELGIEIGY